MRQCCLEALSAELDLGMAFSLGMSPKEFFAPTMVCNARQEEVPRNAETMELFIVPMEPWEKTEKSPPPRGFSNEI